MLGVLNILYKYSINIEKIKIYLHNTHTSLRHTTILLSLVLIFASPVSAFSGGDGSEGNPYQISDVDELQDMKLDLTAHYVLINDIDASDTVNWNGAAGFEPMGNYFDRFTGSLNGQDHEITGLYINRSSMPYVGLFSYAGPGSIIKDVTLNDVKVKGGGTTGTFIGYNQYGRIVNSSASGEISVNRDYVGGLVGFNIGTIKNSSFSGNVTSGRNVAGGLVGYNRYDGQIIGSSASANISGMASIGGLAGLNRDKAIVTGSSFTGKVSGTTVIGGIAGENDGSVINDSYSNGNISASGIRAGGLVGFNNHDNAMIDNSYSSCFIEGAGQSGGLVGCNRGGKITNSYSTGSINGYDETGGFVGYNTGSEISDSYSTCEVFGKDRVGGFVGSNRYATIINSNSAGNVNGYDEVGGLAGHSYQSILEKTYSTGAVSGNNQVGGLVGFSGSSGDAKVSIINSSCSSGHVTGNYQVGGFIGSNSLTAINNTYSIGDASGNDEVGGFVGCNRFGPITISNSYSIGDVSGNSRVGGFVGCYWYNATINDSYWNTETSGQSTSAGGDARTIIEMKYPHASNTYVDWDFENIWSIHPDINDGYPYLRVFIDQDMPSTPTGLSFDKGNFYVNWSWNSGVNTDSFNVSVNGIWHNGTTYHYFNDTPLDPHGTSAIIVYAFNESKSKLSRPASSNVQLDNNPITLTGLADIEMNEGQTAYINAGSIDLDGDTPTFGCDRIDLFTDFNAENGNGSWTTDLNDSGVYNVVFTADDGQGSSDSKIVRVTIIDDNNAPELDPIGNKMVNENEVISFTISATDPDPEDILTYSTNASFGDLTGNEFTWIPGYDDAGEYAVEFSVSDGTLTDSRTMIIEVKEAPTVILTISDGLEEITPNSQLSYEISYINKMNIDLCEGTLNVKIPECASFISASNEGIFDKNSSTVTWYVGNLPKDASGIVYAEVLVNDDCTGEIICCAVFDCKETPEILANDETTIILQAPSIDIEKLTNGNDADIPGSIYIPIGDNVTWKYIVTNTGGVPLVNIEIVDDKVGVVGTKDVLNPGETIEFFLYGTSKLGLYTSEAQLTAEYNGLIITDTDPSSYYGYVPSGGDPTHEVPTAHPLITASVLGIVIIIYMRRK